MPNAQPQGQRADLSGTLINMLNGALTAGSTFASFINDPTKLPRPLTYQERLFLRDVALDRIDRDLFGADADATLARNTALSVIGNTSIDWRSLPDEQALQRKSATGFAAMLDAARWSRTEIRVQQLLLELGSSVYETRVNASSELLALATRLAVRGDFGRYLLVYDRIMATMSTTANPEVRARLVAIQPFLASSAYDVYVTYKIRAAAAAAGWVPYSLPIVVP